MVSIRYAGYAWTMASFGQRYLIHLFVFFVVGLFELTIVSKRIAIALSLICVAWTFLLWNAYLINFASPELRGTLSIQLGGDLTTISLLENIVEEYHRFAASKDGTNPVSFWWTYLGRKPYPTLIHFWFGNPETLSLPRGAT
jgi:hypothetical protein